ncbi:MAG: sulfatase [Acidobacteriota bacterium]
MIPVRPRGRGRSPSAVALLVALGVGALALASCGGEGDPGSDGGAAEAPKVRRPNVLVISLDTLRADRLGSYGYHRDTSPFLDELAARGIRFENAIVNTHGTPPSHTTLLTGLYQSTHRVSWVPAGPEGRNDRVPEGLTLMQEVFQREGYATIGVTDNGYVAANFGFDQGFDVFRDRHIGAEAGTNLTLDLVRQRLGGDKPLFVFYHTYEPHTPYEPPAEYRAMFEPPPSDVVPTGEALLPFQDDASSFSADDIQHLSDLYDAGIRYTDDVMRRFFDELEGLGFFENHLTVVTSDHGEEFGDHGGLLHRVSLYDELLRVPLLISGTEIPAGVVDNRAASLVDVAPTVYTALRMRPRAPISGRDLLGPLEDHPRWAFAQYAGLLEAARGDKWKLIRDQMNGEVELYNLHKDPGETRNVAARNPEMVERLERRINHWRRSCPELDLERRDAQLTDEDVQKLRALGYVQ